MSSRSSSARLAVLWTLVLVCVAGAAAAQTTAGAPGADQIESDPIQCWWRTDKTAIHVGEQFQLILTCGVIETSTVRVEANPEKLDPTAMVLVPFEVLGGTRFRDIVAPPWKYFQYAYTVRLIGDEFFGQDVNVPSVQLTYTVHSAAGGGTEGRDQLYVMPPLPLRVLSLVPRNATDIRDAIPETFAAIEARSFRASAMTVASVILFGFAVVLAGFAVKHMADRYRARVPVASRALPSGSVLRGCLNGLGRLKNDVARDGWTPDLTGRALAVFRVAGAVALDRPISQAFVDRHVPEREGQLAVRTGLLRPKRAIVSAPTTMQSIAAHLSNGNGYRPSVRVAPTLEGLRNSLHVFSAARYGRNGHITPDALDAALDNGTEAVRQLASLQRWPVRAAEALRTTGLGAVWFR